MSDKEEWYRVDAVLFSDGSASIILDSFKVIRHTAKGVWIDFYGKDLWVSTSARKRFAYPSMNAAVLSFIARKNRQVKILSAQISSTRRLLEGAKASVDILLRDKRVHLPAQIFPPFDV